MASSTCTAGDGVRERIRPRLSPRYLLDVGDRIGVDALFKRERPQIVFHAAAYKHVPLLEDQCAPRCATTCFGTGVVAESADRWRLRALRADLHRQGGEPGQRHGRHQARRRTALPGAGARSGTRFITVRFGNVLGSAGSVVPLFQRQIERGGPVTVTDPDIERYFMTIPEACQLIMQAAVIGEPAARSSCSTWASRSRSATWPSR
jgi:FlaA1/EpsC-like NDP-sugar epimerase